MSKGYAYARFVNYLNFANAVKTRSFRLSRTPVGIIAL